MENTLLYTKILALPKDLRAELEVFVEYLKTKSDRQKNKKPVFGSGKGFFTIKKGFDEPLDDFSEYMK